MGITCIVDGQSGKSFGSSLKGYNDGLNTLVPFESDHYRKLRPNIALTASDVFKTGDSAVGPLGLNQHMRALENSIDQDLAIIPGVSY